MNFSKNLNKLLLIGTTALFGVTNILSSELISPTPYAKTIAASVVDSFEVGKATRAFITAMKSRNTLRTGLTHICKEPVLLTAEQEFFTALNEVFSGRTPNVTDNAIDLILKSAQNGYADANDIVKVVSGGKTILEIDKSFYPTLKETIKMRLQSFIDESSSDDEDSASDEIQQLKSYLQIPLSSQISLSELKVAKAEFDISITQVLFETPITSEKAFRSVNSSLSYFLSVCQYDSDKIFDPVFLYILMRMFIDYPSKLDRQIVVELNKTSINKEVKINESIEHYRENGIKIYEWLREKDDGILGEYHI